MPSDDQDGMDGTAPLADADWPTLEHWPGRSDVVSAVGYGYKAWSADTYKDGRAGSTERQRIFLRNVARVAISQQAVEIPVVVVGANGDAYYLDRGCTMVASKAGYLGALKNGPDGTVTLVRLEATTGLPDRTAFPSRWRDIGLLSSECEALERLLGVSALTDEDADTEPFDPANIKGDAEKVLRAIRARRGRRSFRNALIDAYDRRCAITGCDVLALLEAAHITPFRGTETDHVTNGLLLRADLHTLFDTLIIAVDAETSQVLVSPSIQDPTYRDLHGQPLRPTNISAARPSKKALLKHRARCNF
jgi:hypothetical protein